MEKNNHNINYVKENELSKLSNDELRELFILIGAANRTYSPISQELYNEIIRRENEE